MNSMYRHWFQYHVVCKAGLYSRFFIFVAMQIFPVCRFLHQTAAAREASEFVACKEKISHGFRPTECAHDHHWWHSTVLAVVEMMSTIYGLSGPWLGTATDENPGRTSRLLLGLAETATVTSSGFDEAQVLIPGAWGLARAARFRALAAIRVNLAAAEKIGAMSASPGSERRRAGLARAIECMTDAIRGDDVFPELYIERGELFARIGKAKGGGGDEVEGVGVGGAGVAAASDFATALWLDEHVRRRSKPEINNANVTESKRLARGG